MKAPAPNSLISRVIARLTTFPRKHLITVGALCSVLIVTLALNPSKDSETKRHSQSIKLTLSNPEIQELLPDATVPMTPDLVPSVDWHVEKVRSGDNLSLIFQRAGLSDRDLFEFMGGHPDTKILKRIHPGHELEFHIEDDRLLGLRYRSNRLKSELFTREGSKFEHETETLQPDIHTAYREAEIKSSLFIAGQKVKMDANLIMELANIFGWDIDFGLDIRKGDHFKVLYEERFLNGEKIGNGNILAAEFTNQKETFKAVRYEDSKGDAHYYTPDGKSMRKAFLRAPLDFRRISSNFNPRRLHPITKTVRPHRGTDYAASRGTPVWSAGDGRVIRSGYTKPNGNYVVIQHGNNVQTKYLHLHKRKVKTGDRVKQRQVIGTVGSTGYSTAPHLHYEFLLDGVHRNPRTVLDKLPKARSIASSEMPRFLQNTQPLLTTLENHHQQILVAKAGHE
ncbi:peptidoglycan DD-metalloendopeptidase family protein [Aestuariicella sp. G3-2]|uniref:OapA family protein n=1 Tax=Pseudomaricurvus albidus TaxID=2842452 RepID=UPI001C0DB52A|nr:peptidoglycan DD-metalloendopeptidase family protein [Aestuariicella albida]MBU3069469.1 peptidoglycan DD-metalloendopeptidase family protein [Aestuariicella albida]